MRNMTDADRNNITKMPFQYKNHPKLIAPQFSYVSIGKDR